MFIIWIIVEADVSGLLASLQCTTVPFKPMLTESIDNVEIRSEAPGTEFLTKKKMAEFTILSSSFCSTSCNTEIIFKVY